MAFKICRAMLQAAKQSLAIAEHTPLSYLHEHQAQLVSRNETVRPWKISPADYSQILRDSAALRDGLPDPFSLPSKHMLSRFLEGHFRGFHVRLPLLHCVTFSAARVGFELLLSMAAVGALCHYEHAQGYRLYGAARSLVTWRLARKNTLVLPRLVNGEVAHAGCPGSLNRSAATDNTALGDELPRDSKDRDKAGLWTLQAMAVLMAMASWGHRDLTRDALSNEWVEQEERRRTLFVAYSLLNLQSVAFDTPPLILNREVAINLPGCASTWDSPNPTDWSTLRDKHLPPQPFRKMLLLLLLSGQKIHLEAAISSFANHVLIHGLVQHVFLARDSSADRDALSGDLISNMESSLRAWQDSWEATYEATIDPSSPKGPMGFNATALLRLAYIRLNADLGQARRLLGHDPGEVAASSFAAKHVIGVKDRSPQLDRDVLHAHAAPVLEYTTRLVQPRCAFLLARWLLVVSEFVQGSGLDSLQGDERRLVNMVASLVRETEFADSLNGARSHALLVRGLAVSTIRLWAQTFDGSHVFEIVHLVGGGLTILAETLESEASADDPS
ncbi:AmdA [Colletotrichum incanum]|uniref:AmdA n=1 Tax=Colletotrichum incanum TaxID=1573173 RepID=A0A161W1D4_COLIC|nr:AmdA [Colletotrichum incanum]